MIDIHCHILPGLDDGPDNLEDSIAMVKMASEGGTTDIVATPHANLRYSFDPELVDQKIRELHDASGGVVRIHRGCDFHLHYDNVQDFLANPTRYAINQKRYLLIEFSDLLITRTSDEVLERIQATGISPIITHPERNLLLQKRLGQLANWVRRGCLIQVTGQSLLGRFGRRAKRFSEVLMTEGLVHFIASDAHDRRHRPTPLDEAFRYVAEEFGKQRAERLFTLNPAAVLEGNDLDEEAFEPPAARRKWYRFWS